MTPISDALEHATRVLTEAPRGVARGLGDDDLLRHTADLELLGRLVDALRIEAAAEIDARSDRLLGEASLSRRQGCKTGALLIEQITRVAPGEASRRIRLGTAIAPRTSLTGETLPPVFEHIADGFTAGTMTMDAAAVIIRHLTEASRTASPAQLRQAEAHLVDRAATDSAALVAIQAQVACALLDPDGVEPRENELRERRRFRLGREVDGLTPFSGLADPINAGLLRAALADRTSPARQPRFLDPDELAVIDDVPVDTRSQDQRAFDVVFGLLMAGVRADNEKVGSLHGTASVTVLVRADDLARGTGAAWIDDVLSPVSTATTREIACDGGIRLQIEGRKGEILWEGRRERYFTPAQRRAMAARDGGCIWPQCTAPPSRCHAHHVIEWEHGGPTDVDNGALLCSFHHHLLHSSAFQLRMNRGCPELLSPPWLDREQRWRPVTKSRLARVAA